MIIPGSHDGNGFFESLKLGFVGQLIIFCLQHFHITGIAVDIIAEVHKQVGFVFHYQIENGLRLVFVGAGAKGNFGDERPVLLRG